MATRVPSLATLPGDIQAATIDDAKKFFDTYYAPNNAVRVVSGDTTSDEVLKLAEKQFGGIASRPPPSRPDISEPSQTAEKFFTENELQSGRWEGCVPAHAFRGSISHPRLTGLSVQP